ncbi:hypothetical protein BJX65DRAFT_310949 [Aspergillus insuetus]
MPSQLPLELPCQVASYLQADHGTLFNCALVARQWQSAFGRVLYQYICVLPCHQPPQSGLFAEAFCTLVSGPGSEARLGLIREISFLVTLLEQDYDYGYEHDHVDEYYHDNDTSHTDTINESAKEEQNSPGNAGTTALQIAINLSQKYDVLPSLSQGSQEVKELLDAFFTSLGYAAQHMPRLEHISYNTLGVSSPIFLVSVNPETREASARWDMKMDYQLSERVAKAWDFRLGDIETSSFQPSVHHVRIPRLPSVSPVLQARD